MAQGHLPALEFTGLFDSDFRRPGVEAGLYLFRPYEPGKIPVVLVHGLFSSPRAFLQTMNELENDPEVAARYQFWVFLYPTGQPIPASAFELRSSLLKVRETFDPDHSDPAMARMVLVGHSMGGLLSKMMVQDSGLTLWDAAFRRPAADLKATPATRKILDDSLIFAPPALREPGGLHRHPPPGERRSPTSGSAGPSPASSSGTTRPAGSSARSSTSTGPTTIAPEFRRVPLNAISNLRTDSPILKPPSTRSRSTRRSPTTRSSRRSAASCRPTAIVEYKSSHLDGVVSEKIVPGTHSAQQDPDVIVELKRILALHLGSP